MRGNKGGNKMKQKNIIKFLVFLIFLSCVVTSGQLINIQTDSQWIPIESDKPDAPKISSKTFLDAYSGEIKVTISLPGYYLRKFRDIFYVDIPGSVASGKEGMPAIPAYLVKLALPPNAKVQSVEIVKDISFPIVIDKIVVYKPAKNIDEVAGIEKSFIASKYPQEIYKYTLSSLPDGNNLLNFVVYPLSFEPNLGFILHQDLDFKIKFEHQPLTSQQILETLPKAWNDAYNKFSWLSDVKRGFRNSNYFSALNNICSDLSSPYAKSLIAFSNNFVARNKSLSVTAIDLRLKENRLLFNKKDEFEREESNIKEIKTKDELFNHIKFSWHSTDAIVVYYVYDEPCSTAATVMASYMNWPLIPYESEQDVQNLVSLLSYYKPRYIFICGNIHSKDEQIFNNLEGRKVFLKNPEEINLLNYYFHIIDWQNGIKSNLPDPYKDIYTKEIANKDFKNKVEKVNSLSDARLTNIIYKPGYYLVLYSTGGTFGVDYSTAATALGAYRGAVAIENASNLTTTAQVRDRIEYWLGTGPGTKYVVLFGAGTSKEIPAFSILDPIDDGVYDNAEPGGDVSNGIIFSDFFYETDRDTYNNQAILPNVSWTPWYYIGRIVIPSNNFLPNLFAWIQLIKKYELGIIPVNKNKTLIVAPLLLHFDNRIAWEIYQTTGTNETYIYKYPNQSKNDYISMLKEGVSFCYTNLHGNYILIYWSPDEFIFGWELEDIKPAFLFYNSCVTGAFLGDKYIPDNNCNSNPGLNFAASLFRKGKTLGIIAPTALAPYNPFFVGYTNALSSRFVQSLNSPVGIGLAKARKDYYDLDSWFDYNKDGVLKTIYEFVLLGDPAVTVLMGNDTPPNMSADDEYEENDADYLAKSLFSGNDITIKKTDLVARDPDWFKFTVTSSADIKINIKYDGEIGNLYYALFNQQLQSLSSGWGSSGLITVEVTNQPSGDYYLLVWNVGEPANLYDLEITTTSSIVPWVKIDSPQNGSVISGTQVINVSSHPAITQVNFYCDNTLIFEDTSPPWGFSFSTTSFPDGVHYIKVTGYYQSKTCSDQIQVTISNTSTFNVKITHPENNSCLYFCCNTKLSITSSNPIVRADLYVDGGFITSDYTAPFGDFTICYNAPYFQPYGEHIITIKVQDSTGKIASDSIKIFVSPPPNVQILGYSNYQKVHGVIYIEAQVESVFPIDYVKFWKDGDILAQIEASPYVVVWDTTKEKSGKCYQISVDAVNIYGATGNCYLYLCVDQLPSISILSPANNATLSGTVEILTDPRDDRSIRKVEFYVKPIASQDYTLLATVTASPWKTTWNTNDFADGAYNIKAIAYDSGNQTADSTIGVQVDNDSPPQVQITYPHDGDIVTSSVVNITATASDDKPSLKVNFLVDGNLICSDDSSPYECSWNTAGYSLGEHAIVAQAIDSIRQTSMHKIKISLQNPGIIAVNPSDNFNSSGPVGGPFNPASMQYTLQNTGGQDLNWTATVDKDWVTLSQTSGTLTPGQSINVIVSINDKAKNLPAAQHSATVTFRNTSYQQSDITRLVNLTVIVPPQLSVTPADNFISSGPVGGPFTPSSKSYILQNTGGQALNWTVNVNQNWVSLSQTTGTLNAGEQTTVVVFINSNANSLTAGSYNAAITFTNTTNGQGNTTRSVILTTLNSITVTTSPAGLRVIVDGTEYTAPQSFNWTPGSSHTIGVSSPQSGPTGTRYVFSSWSDGGAQTHTIITPSSATTYTASFTTQYSLTTSASPAEGGTVTPSGTTWYDSGQSVQVQATPASGYVFSSWSGDLSGFQNPVSITMNGPKNVVANFAQTIMNITVTTSPSGLKIIVDGTEYTAPQSFNWTPGSSHTIGVSSPQTGADGTRYVFSSWSDGGAQTHTIIAPSSLTTYTAYFTVAPEIIISRSSLQFGSANGNERTCSQQFFITSSNSVEIDWVVTENADWLNCLPTSGKGNGIVTISVDPAGLSVGTYTAKITVSSTKAINSPQTVNVTLKVMEPRTTSPPFGFFDTPIDKSLVFGSVPVTGWALDDIEVTKIEIKRSPHPSDNPAVIGPDGLVYIGDAVFVEGARTDIEQLYPTFPLNYRAGWGYMMLTNFLPNQGNGTFTIHAIAYDKEGHRVSLGSKTINCDNANATLPFGTIDTPGQGATVSGSSYVNFGWALTPQPKMIPTDGSTILVWVDGVPLGHPVYNQYRYDIATLFPGYKNSNGAVGYYYLDTTKYANGVHTIAWSVMDDAGSGTGIGSRYFTVMNIASSGAMGNTSDQMQKANLGSLTPNFSALEPSRFIYSPSNYLHYHNYRLIMGLPADLSPILFRRGYSLALEPEVAIPDQSGLTEINIKEIDRIEILLDKEKFTTGADKKAMDSSKQKSDIFKPMENNQSKEVSGAIYYGYMIVGKETKPLPIGSTLDSKRGIFFWQPGPGFLGAYDLVFIKQESSGQAKKIRIRVNVRPRF